MIRIRQALVAVILISLAIPVSGQRILSLQFEGEMEYGEVTAVIWDYGKESVIWRDSVRFGRFACLIPDTMNHRMIGFKIQVNGIDQYAETLYTGSDEGWLFHPDEAGFRIEGTGETPVFNHAMRSIDTLEKGLLLKLQLLSYFKGYHDFAAKTRQSVYNDLSHLDLIYQAANSEPGLILVPHFLNARRKWISDTLVSLREQYRLNLDHYFDHFRPQDTLVQQSPIFETNVLDYAESAALVSGTGGDSLMIMFLDRLFSFMDGQPEAILFAGNLVRPVLNKYGFDQAMIHMDQQYLASQCHAETDLPLQERLAAYARTAKGQPGPDLKGVGSEGQVISFAFLPDNPVLLVFWATWCPHCREILPEIHRTLSENDSLSVVAIGLDAEEAAWRDEILQYSDWIHIRGKEVWQDFNARQYGIYATPAFFVLDKDRIIKGRAKNLAEIKTLLQNNR